VDSRQTGLTLRPMESIFFEKKLITNHLTISDYDFYDKSNIFILGKDDLNNLSYFLKQPYNRLPAKLVDGYDFNTWLKRFGI
jgi:hypothetical protein